MRKAVTCLLVVSITLLFSASVAIAGLRHYRFHDYGYRYPQLYHHPVRYRHHHGPWLPVFGAGLITGVVVSSVAAPPPPRAVYLPAPTVVYAPPANLPPPPVAQSEMVLRQVSVTEKLVNLRSGPGLDTAILGSAVAGQVVDVIGTAPEWLYVRTGSRQYGWIMTRFTAEVASPVG
jgi:uncharacterized protein YgiM (DUF1202 family)